MPQIKDSFILNSNRPNFERDQFQTLNDMAKISKSQMDEGHISYCIAEGKHYIFTSERNNHTGYFKELLLQDVQVVTKINDLKVQSFYDQMPIGKLVFCTENEQIYYKYSNTKGFKLLIDLQSSNYVSTSSPEWTDMQTNVQELTASGMLTFETVDNMSNHTVNKSNPLKPGQLAYCKSNNQHYYYPYEGIEKKGFFGYFRTVCDEGDKLPIITQPSATASIKKENYTDNSTWRWFERNGEAILLIPYTDIDSASSNVLKYIELSIDRGKIDYSNFPYFNNESKKFNYIEDGNLVEILYPNNYSFVAGDNEIGVSIAPETGAAPTVVDIDGIDNHNLSWGTKSFLTNTVTVNVTKPWKASTSTESDLEDQPLIPWEETMVGYATLQPTCVKPQKIRIPDGRSTNNVKIYSNVLGGWVDETNEWSGSQTKTYNGGTRGTVEIKVEF